MSRANGTDPGLHHEIEAPAAELPVARTQDALEKRARERLLFWAAIIGTLLVLAGVVWGGAERLSAKADTADVEKKMAVSDERIRQLELAQARTAIALETLVSAVGDIRADVKIILSRPHTQ